MAKLTATQHKTREEWLQAAARILADHIARSAPYDSPDNLRFACGWPLGTRKAKGKVLGQCFSHTCSKDGTYEIFITPALDDPAKVLGTLLHEMLHATVGLEHGHKGAFAIIARKVGLEGKMTATVPGPDLATKIATWLKILGTYPHATLSAVEEDAPGRKKQGTRLLKVICPACGYTVRTTAKWIDEGLPTCPCGTEMECENENDDAGE